METQTHRRRQHHSCDQCRKGKRACDAPVRERGRRGSIQSSASSPHSNLSGQSTLSDGAGPCSNCKRWKKECTFNWLSSVQTTSQAGRRKKRRERTAADATQGDADAPNDTTLDGTFDSGACVADDFQSVFSLVHTSDLPWSWSPGESGTNPSSLERNQQPPGVVDPFGPFPWDMSAPDVPLAYEGVAGTDQVSQDINGGLGYSHISSNSVPHSLDEGIPVQLPFDDSSPDLNDGLHFSPLSSEQLSGSSTSPFPPSPRSRRARLKDWGHMSDLSDGLADKHVRSTMTQNLFRIYHDSMENALSCWLTERNCPYSSDLVTSSSRRTNGVEREWGPNWSNRICSRVCRLDRAYSSVRGRHLTVTEERAASRTLHASIMAFASQWTQNSQERTGNFRALSSRFQSDGRLTANADFDRGPPGSVPSSVSHFERSIQENLWSLARQALNDSVGIPSFRVVFANIIFSLTQRPLDIQEHIGRMDRRSRSSYDIPDIQPDEKASGVAELHELFDNDCAPTFLETALRQMFTFRYQLTRRQRQTAKSSNGARAKTSSTWQMGPISSIQQEPDQIDPVLPKPEYYETFNLLFWLGVMFDTLTAAMHQRPLVISDEDSQVTCVVPSLSRTAPIPSQIDLDGWDVTSDGVRNDTQKSDLWGDLFLHKSGVAGQGSHNVARWPCSYRAAAETLSDATPVKVLLYRRVTHLQTLVYRGAEPECLEGAIQDNLLVYQHWNTTYRRFFLDCVAHHDDLPPRIQSWYVILAGHWHLAAMLLADTVERIDRAGMGMVRPRESRSAIDLVSTLRRENAMAVSSLARCSLARRDRSSFAKLRQFHDAVNEGALLTEPWTVVLVRSFTTAGYILLEGVDISPHAAVHPPPRGDDDDDDPSEISRRHCGFCIDALWCLGRKSDMAFLAARALSNGLDRRLQERRRLQSCIAIPDYGAEDGAPGVYDSVPSMGPVFA